MVYWKFLTLLTVGVALLWETRFAYGLAYVGLVLFFILQFVQVKACKGLMVKRDGEELYLFPGDQGQVAVQVQNISRLPLAWVSLADRLPSNLAVGRQGQRPVFSLSPHSSQMIHLNIKARERGVYRLGPLDVFVGDFFGIHTQKFQADEYATVVVYPQTRPLADLSLPSRLSFGNLKSPHWINHDPTRLAGVRPYQQGDALRTIHWAATARTQNFQVKQFDHRVSIHGLICLDFFQAGYEVSSYYVHTELAVSAAASFATHLLHLGESCGLLTNAILTEYLPDETEAHLGEGFLHIHSRQGMAQLTRILTLLAGVKTQNNLDFPTLLVNYGQNVEPGTILFWIVPQDTPDIVAQAWRWVKRGYQVQIFVVGKIIHSDLLQQPRDSSLQMFEVRAKGVLSE